MLEFVGEVCDDEGAEGCGGEDGDDEDLDVAG